MNAEMLVNLHESIWFLNGILIMFAYNLAKNLYDDIEKVERLNL